MSFVDALLHGFTLRLLAPPILLGTALLLLVSALLVLRWRMR